MVVRIDVVRSGGVRDTEIDLTSRATATSRIGSKAAWLIAQRMALRDPHHASRAPGRTSRARVQQTRLDSLLRSPGEYARLRAREPVSPDMSRRTQLREGCVEKQLLDDTEKGSVVEPLFLMKQTVTGAKVYEVFWHSHR